MIARPCRAPFPPLAALVAAVMMVLTVRPADAAGTFRTFDTEGLRIVVDAEWGLRLAPGYLPVRLDVTNLSDARTLTFSVVSNRYSFVRRPGLAGRPSTGRKVIDRTIALARGARARFTLPIPIGGDNENLQLTVRDPDRVVQVVNLGGAQSNVQAEQASVLIVTGGGSAFGKQAAGWVRENPTPASYGGPKTLLDIVLEPSRLPAAWIGYSSLRAVLIGGSEWNQLSDEQRSALRRWTAAGGDLIVADGEPGSNFVAGVPLAGDEATRSTVPYLFGYVHRLSSSEIATGGLQKVLDALPGTRYSYWRLPVNRTSDWTSATEQGFRLPIPGVGRVHARGYLTLLLLFAVLIGPVNYVYLQRRGLQPLLVVTAPLIAVVFLVLLGTYVIAGEGFSVHARAATFTLLDQARQEAVTRSAVSMYAAGRTPGDGLRFSAETAVYPFDFEGNAGDTHVDLANGQQFDNGLVRARTPANFETVEWRPARERLTFSRQGETIRVTNGLGVTVSQLLLRTDGQAYQLSAPLAPGAEGLLRKGNGQPLSPVRLSHPLYPRFQEAALNQPVNSYLGVVDRSPFWQVGISGAMETDSVHLILGLVEPLP